MVFTYTYICIFINKTLNKALDNWKGGGGIMPITRFQQMATKLHKVIIQCIIHIDNSILSDNTVIWIKEMLYKGSRKNEKVHPPVAGTFF